MLFECMFMVNDALFYHANFIIWRGRLHNKHYSNIENFQMNSCFFVARSIPHISFTPNITLHYCMSKTKRGSSWGPFQHCETPRNCAAIKVSAPGDFFGKWPLRNGVRELFAEYIFYRTCFCVATYLPRIIYFSFTIM